MSNKNYIYGDLYAAQSGGTIFSGGTALELIFAGAGTGDLTRVQAGTNTTTGGTSNEPTVNLVDSPSINNLEFSGTATGGDVFATNLSGGTIYSGSTDLGGLFVSTVNGVTTSGGTVNTLPMWDASQNLTDSIMSFTGPSGITVTGDVFISGNVEVLGTATTINTQDLAVADNNILLNSGGTHTSALYGGIAIEDGVSTGVDSVWVIDASGNWSANTSVIAQGFNAESGAILSGGTDLYNIFGAGGGETLAQTLALGNTTGANDISLDNGQKIVATNGDAYLDLRSGGDSVVALLNDSGFAKGMVYLTSDKAHFGWDYSGNFNHGLIVGDGGSDGNFMSLLLNEKNIIYSQTGGNMDLWNANTTSAGDSPSVIMASGQFSRVATGITNTVIVGGDSITATTSNSLYAQNARLAENGGVIYSAGTDLYNIFGAGGGGTLAQTLAFGNTTGANDISLDDGQNLIATNGGGILKLREGGDNIVFLGSSGGTYENSWVYMDQQANLLAYGPNDTDGVGVFISADIASVPSGWDDILIKRNAVNNAVTRNTDKDAIIIGSRNSTINAGVTNSVVVGGVGVTASQDDTLYTQNFDATAITGDTIHADAFFSMTPYTDGSPASPSDNDTWFHSGATGTITLNYRIGGNNFSVELAP